MATSTALAQIGKVLSAKREWGSPLGQRELEQLARAHGDYIGRREVDELREMRATYLEPFRAFKKAMRGTPAPDPGPGFAEAIGRLEVGPVLDPRDDILRSSCATVAIPPWATDTQLTRTQGRRGWKTLAASSRSAGTFQIGAACGKFTPYNPNPNADVPGDDICAGFGEFNQARAVLSTPFYVPELLATTLRVTVRLDVEDVSGTGGLPFPTDNVFTMAGDPNLGANGGAAAWINALLTVHMPTARYTASQKIMAGWSAYGATQQHTEAPTGRSVILSRSMPAPAAGTTALLAVDLHAVAFAQGFAADIAQAWARVQVDESATVNELDGYAEFPSRIRVRSVQALLCEEFRIER